MPQYAVVNMPDPALTTLVEKFREKYDMQYKLIPAHVTLFFPVSSNDIDEAEALHHIEAVVEKIVSFKVVFDTMQLSEDGTLFLVASQGRDHLAKLHDLLYTGKMHTFLRQDLPFVPHITIGNFPRSNTVHQENYKDSLKYLQSNPMHVSYLFQSVDLIKIDDNATRIDIVKTSRMKE